MSKVILFSFVIVFAVATTFALSADKVVVGIKSRNKKGQNKKQIKRVRVKLIAHLSD